MEPTVLTDPNVAPSENLIFSHIGGQRVLWEALTDLKKQFSGAAPIGKLRGITITFRKKSDVEDAKALVALDRRVRVLTEFTRDRPALERALAQPAAPPAGRISRWLKNSC